MWTAQPFPLHWWCKVCLHLGCALSYSANRCNHNWKKSILTWLLDGFCSWANCWFCQLFPCHHVICLNSTLPTLICNSKWSLYVQTSGRNDIEDRRGRFWGQNVLNKVNPRILVLLCTVQIWNISNWVFLTEARSSLNNIIMVITESDILWRLKVNPEVFLLQQIPTLWWALWKCTRDVSPLS